MSKITKTKVEFGWREIAGGTECNPIAKIRTEYTTYQYKSFDVYTNSQPELTPRKRGHLKLVWSNGKAV